MWIAKKSKRAIWALGKNTESRKAYKKGQLANGQCFYLKNRRMLNKILKVQSQLNNEQLENGKTLFENGGAKGQS